MSKNITLILSGIRYDGASIGNDVRIEIDVLGKTARYETRLKKGERIAPNLILGATPFELQSIVIPATIRAIEHDVLFPDKGQATVKLKINPTAQFPQTFTHTIAVRENRGFLTKRTARFEVTIEANTGSQQPVSYKSKSIAWWETWKEMRAYTNRGTNGKEDYNRYDSIIQKEVARWNKEFCDDSYPPPEPLDPNLVKAMIFQESRIGYDRKAEINVMQVGNTGDPSLKTLRGELTEHWIRNGKEQKLHYDAGVTTIEESIRWGTRWLYHKAQGIKNSKRYWRTWHEAVEGYGPPKKVYSESVWNIYEKGLDIRGKQPLRLFTVSWIAVAAVLCGVSLGTYAFQNKQIELSQIGDTFSFEEKLENNPDTIEQRVRTLVDRKMTEYRKQDSYYYGDLFAEPFHLCNKFDQICFSDLIFPAYLDELVRYSKSMKPLKEVVESLDIATPYNSFYEDLDNDGEAEFGIFLTDYLNHEYLDLIIIDHAAGSFHVSRSRLKRQYSGGIPRVIDLTGDAIPEIVVFSSGGRQDVQLYVYQYGDGELKKILSLERDYLRVDIIFTDQNHNHLPEIKVKGERFGDECMACDHEKVDESFEYNQRTGQFDLI